MEKTATTKKEIVTSGGARLAPGTYTGRYFEDGGVLHVVAQKPGDIYRVYRIPCIEIESSGDIFRLTYLDSKDIPSTPKVLVSEGKLLGYAGGAPIYGD